jgi:hypothetical protein
MKLLKKNLIILMVLTAIPLITKAQESSKNDKAFVLNYFQETLDKLDKSVNGLSEAQLHFKVSDSTWSISQCLEHIIKTEPMIFGMVKGYMEQPANPDRRKDIKVGDEEIIEMVTDRSEKFKAPEILKGEGKYKDAEAAINDLKSERIEILAFIGNTPMEELRNRVNDSPAGATDAYQSLLFLAGHTGRHTLQIEEIKAAANFPEN